MEVQQVYQLHLKARSGALVEVVEGHRVKGRKWLVVSKDDCLGVARQRRRTRTGGRGVGGRRDGRLQCRIEPERAEVRVFFDTRIHTFFYRPPQAGYESGDRRVVRLSLHKRRFDLYDIEGLKDLPPIHKTHPQTTTPEIQEKIIASLALLQARRSHGLPRDTLTRRAPL